MNRVVTAVAAAVLAFGLAGCGNSAEETNKPPIPTAAATNNNGDPAKLVMPSDLIGKNAQLADDELRKVGFINVKYGSADTAAVVDTAHLADWNVAKVEPAGGTLVQSNDNIVVTAVKK